MASADVIDKRETVMVPQTVVTKSVVLTLSTDEATVLRGFLGSFSINDKILENIWYALSNKCDRPVKSYPAGEFLGHSGRAYTIDSNTSSKILGK